MLKQPLYYISQETACQQKLPALPRFALKGQALAGLAGFEPTK